MSEEKLAMKRTKLIVNRTLLVVIVTALAVGSSLSQGIAPTGQQPSTKGAVIKGKAPVNKEILRVKLPKPQELKLSNGIPVILHENHKLPTFDMQLVVLSGGISYSPDAIGGAQFTSSLLREGTRTRTSKQIAEQVDSLGASLSANSGLSSIT